MDTAEPEATAPAAQSNADSGTSKTEKTDSAPTEPSSSAAASASASAPGSRYNSRHGRDGNNAGRTGGHWDSTDHCDSFFNPRFSNSNNPYQRNRPPNYRWQRNDYSDRSYYGQERYSRYERRTSEDRHNWGYNPTRNNGGDQIRQFNRNPESKELKETEIDCESKRASKAGLQPLETQKKSKENPENKESPFRGQSNPKGGVSRSNKCDIPARSKKNNQNHKSQELKRTEVDCKSKGASKADTCLLKTPSNLKEQPENKERPFSGQSNKEKAALGGDSSQIKVPKPIATRCSKELSFSGTFRDHDQTPTKANEKPSENPPPAAESESSQTYPKIKVRPLTELLNHEIQAATEKNRLGRTAPPERPPNPLSYRPAPKIRRLTVAGSGALDPPDSPTSIKSHLATLDKESLKYIINNSDTIYEEHLKFQARKRRMDEIGRQLKKFDLEKPKESRVTLPIEDEIVDDIDLPKALLQEIEKCLSISTSEADGSKSSPQKEKVALEKREIQTEPSIKRGECSKNSPESKQEQEQNSSIKSGQCSKIPEKEKNSSPTEKETPTETMAGANNLMRRLKAADEVKTMTAVRQYNGRLNGSLPPRGPLLPFPKQDKKLSSGERQERKVGISSPKKAKPKDKTKESTPKDTAPAPPEATLSIKKEITDCEIIQPTGNATIVVSSSSDEDEAEAETVDKPHNKTQPQRQATAVAKPNDEEASDHSTTSQCSTESSKRRYRQRLKLDAAYVVDSFEKLILPHLKESLAERYKSLNSDSIHTRLHFISCVVTSSDHNSQSISKMEIAKMQNNLKLRNNRQGIEFLLRQMVHVVNQQKQQAAAKRSKEQEAKKLSNRISTVTSAASESAESAKEPPPHQRSLGETAVAPPSSQSPRQSSPSPSSRQSPPALPSRQSPPALPSRQSPPALPSRQSPPALPPRQSPPALSSLQSPPGLPFLQSPPALPPRPIIPPFSVYPSGFLDSTLARVSPGVYSLSESTDLLELSNDMVAHYLVEIDLRLLENQNRRSLLEEMIMKFQKEKSDLEIHSLELQNRKFLLLNLAICRNHGPATASSLILSTLATPVTAAATNSRPPIAESQAEVLGESCNKSEASSNQTQARRKGRVRRAVVVKYLPKRRARFNRRTAKRNDNSDELVAQLQLEIAAKEQTEKSEEISPKMPMPLMEPDAVIKEEPMDFCNAMESQSPPPIIAENGASPNKRSADPIPAAASRPKQSRKSKTITSTVSESNPTQQPLAIIPPLPPPPPPPPEPNYNMPYQLPRSILKAPPPLPTQLRQHTVESNGDMGSDLGFIRKGRLHSVVSPITQIRIYKNHILAAAEDGDIYIFNLHNHKLERQIPKHGEAITNMHLCEKESFLYTTSLDGFLKKSSLENLESVQQTVYVKEPLQSIDIAWDAAFIGSRWGHIFVYNVVTNKMIESPLLSTGQSIIAVKATKEGHRKIIILGCKGNFVNFHDAATGLLLRRLGVPDGLNVYSLLLNDGHVYCGTQKNEIYKFEFASGNLVTKLSCGNGAVSMVSFRDRYLLIGCYDGFIYVLDKHKGSQVGRFEGAGRLVLALAIAGDSIVTSSKDNSLEVLEIPPEMLNGGQKCN
ncbi:uncharacterized protein LOC108155085 isoform X2 [Drosophila miranda]|uniref:uncharacterized protein LOC108155085 isoform X2 n=1 Tax=Drosophila miranda TaxID=7229 RepID=UPI00143F685C|nr:uncharacterized protein LOC108155085 isoform X2 [Drosophila miranda]